MDITSPQTFVLTNEKPLLIHKNTLYHFENEFFNGNKLKPFLKKDEIVVNEKLQGDFFRKFIKPVVRKFEYSINGFDLIEKKPEINSLLKIEKTFFGTIILTPVFRYGDYKVEFYKEQKVFVDVLEKNGEYYLESVFRDEEYESGMLEKLINLGLKRADKYFYFEKDLKDKYSFVERFAAFVPGIGNAGFKIVNYLFDSEINYSTPEIIHETVRKSDWFDLHIIIRVGKNTIRFPQLKKHILNRIPEYKFPDGTIFVIPVAWFSMMYPLAVRTSNNTTSIHLTQLKLLESNEFIERDETIINSLNELDAIEIQEFPKNMTAGLRDYQKTGFQWLYHHTQKGFGVCLADDMGLGKTVQVITTLQKYFENKQFDKTTPVTGDNTQLSLFANETVGEDEIANILKPALIIVPKSLVYNWIEELKKFAPELKYRVYGGKDRQVRLKRMMNRTHIILATYGIVRQDFEYLRAFDFGYLVLDESQVIKNPGSKIHNAVKSIVCESKICMTGTPIENNLYDLWAQLSFLNGHLLGNLNYFEKTYVNPIVKDQDVNREQELRHMIKPFILRRLKKDVARELPEKTEQVIYCTMNELQNEIYETEKSAVRNKFLLGEVDKKNYLQVFAMLNRLRQITIHPALLDEYDNNITSGKFETIIATIENLLEEGHKFLVFSSFVKHLNLFKDYFIEKGISFSMLTGSDNNRKEIVEGYQNDETVKPFLISVKAGGTGLNLTAASYVLIVDPWWNPFVEQQAIDRTHRIGQTQNVTVYKFITKDTIEEKILHLQKAKRQLSDSFINADTMQNISLTEIEDIILHS